jgi:two-component sensor histidine kinase
VEEKEMLMREIHHRVKNNLQVMSGLLQLQSNATGNDDLKNSLAQSQKRITSIAAIHELLYTNHQVQQVDMQAYFEKIVVQTIQIHDEKIQYHIDTHQLRLDMDKAIPLGLILNELVTNSFKHAFVDQDSASISVNLNVSEQKPFAYYLQYRDNGKTSFENTAKQQSLGVRIISMMAEQLHGELSFSFEEGARYDLYF